MLKTIYKGPIEGRGRTQMGPMSRSVYRLLTAASAPVFADLASANPFLAPTVDYTADVEITRDSDHSFAMPARYVYGGRRIRVELVGIVTLVDLDRRETVAMIPRVRTYWRPVPFAQPANDGRRWVGVEPQEITELGEDTLLGQRVTKYYVRGTIFDTHTPFEGEVWTTVENIVLRVDGVSRGVGFSAPIKVTTLQLVVAPADQRLLRVPENYARAARSDPGPRPDD